MSLSKQNPILAATGYVVAKDVIVGMVLRTPLGDTTVVRVFETIERQSIGVNIDDVRLFGFHRMLLPDLTWGVVKNDAYVAHQVKTGFMSDKTGLWLGSPSVSTVFSFVGDALVSPDMFTSDCTLESRIHIETENKIIVVGRLIADGHVIPSLNGETPPMGDYPLPTITQDQLEAFKNEYF